MSNPITNQEPKPLDVKAKELEPTLQTINFPAQGVAEEAEPAPAPTEE